MTPAYVLAGGASSRMGTDKARLPHQGWPLAVHLVGLLRRAGFEPHLIRRGAPESLPWFEPDGTAVHVVYEPDTGERHPLAGVVTALEHAKQDVVVCPCDLPCLTWEALEALHQPGVAHGEQRHPLVAHVPYSLRAAVHEGVRTGASARQVFSTLPSIPFPPATLVDRNTPDGPSTLERLRSSLHWLPDAAVERVLEGERRRQRARGVVDRG